MQNLLDIKWCVKKATDGGNGRDKDLSHGVVVNGTASDGSGSGGRGTGIVYVRVTMFGAEFLGQNVGVYVLPWTTH